MLLTGPILCIDDEDDQYLTGEAISQLGLPNPVLFFHNGQEALGYLETTAKQLSSCEPLESGAARRYTL